MFFDVSKTPKKYFLTNFNIMKITALCLLSFAFLGNVFAQKSPFVRFPALSPDGKTLSFSYQGDICTVPAEGGNATRLTIHEAYEGISQWSPDGKQIAFVSNRFGNDDIFILPTSGNGTTRRLTFHSAKDVVTDWQNGTIYLSTKGENVQVEREREMHKVAETGGTPSLALNALGDEAVVSPDGRYIAYTRGINTNDRYAYKGSAQKDIWLYDTKNASFSQITTYGGNDFNPQWADNRTLYFISAQSGKFNIYRTKIGEDAKAATPFEALTKYTDDNVRFFRLSKNGAMMCFEYQTDVYTQETQNGKAKLVQIALPSDFRLDPIEYKNASSGINEFSVSPNGKLIVFAIRGEVFLKENDKEKSRSVRLTNHAANDKEPEWLNDSTIIFTSDRFGQYDLMLLRSSDAKQKNLFKTLKYEEIRLTETPEDENNIAVAPDNKKLVFARAGGKLVLAQMEGDKIKEEKNLLDSWASPAGLAWSPDSRFLAYSLEDLLFNEEVYIHPIDGTSKPTNVSMHPKSDNSPTWSQDGSKLGFLSSRNNGDSDVWYVWLKKSDWQKTRLDWDKGDDAEPETKEKKDEKKDEKDDKKGKDEKKKEVKPIDIDFDRIYDRLVQLTSLPGNETDLAIAKDGKTFYFVTNRSGRGAFKADNDLYSIKWDGKDLKSITSGNTSPYAVKMDKQYSNLFYLSGGGRLSKVDLGAGKPEGLPFTANYTINYPLERMQIFEEAWRTINNGFYDPKFHGRDWAGLRKKYSKWAEVASTERDFRDVVNLMLGEIDASHMGHYGADRATLQYEITGLLGVAIEPLKEGVKVLRVIMDSPADREKSKLFKDDVILSVDGVNITAADNFHSFFINKSNNEVILQVKGKDNAVREVIITPTNNLDELLYSEWVRERREMTDKLSNGKLGYLHIEGMDWESFERFEREITAVAANKEGMVIDVRYNGGGWTTDYLMIVLGTKQHAYTVPRGAAKDLEKEHKNFREFYPYSERLPFAVWTKPAATICNESSYSNAEIFSHAFKNLKLGPLVGMPTYGAVISTGGRNLIDGSLVRLPFRGWYSFQGDENMELIPAKPDIILDNAPDSKFKGKDEQLEKTIQTLLKK